MPPKIPLIPAVVFLFTTVTASAQEPAPPPLPERFHHPVTMPVAPGGLMPLTPLQVTFTGGLLSVRAQHAPLKAVAEAIARQTGLTVTFSPSVEAIPVTVALSHVGLEPALQEILRRAGITNAAWTYRKKPRTPARMDEWELTRLAVVAAGGGTPLPIPEAVSPPKPENLPRAGTHLASEQYLDPHTNQSIAVAEREVLVRFDPEMSPDLISQTVGRLNAEVIDQVAQFGLYHLLIPEAETVSGFIRKHQNDPSLHLLEPNPIISVEPVGAAPNDPLFRSQWALERIGAPQAWALVKQRTGGTVAVIDSGIDRGHPDLRNRVLSGWNVIDRSDDTRDDHGHGTAIAGVIAATTNNAVGMAGVCPRCQILPVKVLDDEGNGTYAQVIAGILWAADHKAQVINLSLGSYGYSRFLAAAVDYAHQSGAVLVAAAGNEATDAPLYPAALPRVIAVSATDAADHAWEGSNYGASVDLAAPGVGILSLATDDEYVFATGSSFSAAHVAGVAALVRAKHPSLGNAHVAQLLFRTADDLGKTGKDGRYGFGRVSAARALRVKPRTS